MVEGTWLAPGAALGDAEAVRKAVLGRGADELDALSWNVVVRWEGRFAATGRLWWRDGAFWLGDIAVLPEARGVGLGDLVLRLLLFKAESHAARMMRLACPEPLEGFFARLGFRREGVRENGALVMALPGDELCLDSCQNCQKDCPNRR